MRPQLLLVCMLCLAIAACGKKPEALPSAATGVSQSGLTAAGAHSWADVQVAYDRAQRLRDLLGTDAPASLTQAQMGLGNLLAGIAPATAPAIDAAVEAMLAAQAQAYAVAVDTGRASPGVADPGAWDATWWDFSSP